MNFDHTQRDRDLVIERYLAGRLPADETESFEEHYLDCPDCLDQLEAARGLRRGLATVAAEDAERAPRGARRWLLLAAAALLVALLPAVWLGLETRRLGSELAATRDRLDAAQATAVPPSRLAELEHQLADQASHLTGLAAELARERAPQPNALLVPLAVQRSGGGKSVHLQRPAGAGRIVFALAVGPDDDGPFDLVLRREGEVLWRGEGLRPDGLGDVRVSFHRDSLPPGAYWLELTTPGSRGEGVHYDFRVQPGPDDEP
ncbi:MAG: zf-HC2 domain-containing protein [Thermoanaerobaculia bacterium]|nr:zf-HC2 domain-containing protein [Thermoanaerobaculia bacterium]